MGELARRRSARDLWISRSHVMAATAGAAVLTAVSFGSGYLMGRGSGAPARTEISGVVAAPDGELVELLARVEATAASNGGVEDLTFPDVLRGQDEGAMIPAMGPTPLTDEPLVVEPAEAPDVEGDPLPSGRFTIDLLRTTTEAEARELQEHLIAQGVDAFVAVEMSGGQLEYRLAAGGYRTEQAAADALGGVRAALGDRPATPTVGPLR